MSSHDELIGKRKVHVVVPEDSDKSNISSDDLDMDRRAKAAVNSAINKAKVCKLPVAKYDKRKKKAYVEKPDGAKEYVD